MPAFNLKRSLMLQVVVVAGVCFFLAAALALFGTCRGIRNGNEHLAAIVTKQLQLQLFRIKSNIGVPWQFPDWDPVAQQAQNAGQCVKYIKSEGGVGQSSCVGFNPDNAILSPLFSSLSAQLLAAQTDVARPILYDGKSYGTLTVTIEPQVVLATIWKDLTHLLGLTAMVVIAICILLYVAISRALRPAKDVLIGLDMLGRGDLSYRLPNFRLVELQRISEVFNSLAGSLDQTTRERTALAVRLVDGQEQERLHLARELHDELAQTLSAISAIAASIKTTAERECPVLVSEAINLSQISMDVMKSLRATLRTLRPPEIDDFGLPASLSVLTAEHERRSAGKLKISLDLDSDLQGLSPTAASHVYRIVQEGLNNIGKHAKAGLACVTLRFRAEPSETGMRQRRWLALTIEDDGCGAIYRGIIADGNGLGLIGIRERVMALGGQLDIIDLGGQGFRLQALIPFETPAELSA